MAKYNLMEVFEMAEQIERNGYKFYTQGAESCSDKFVKSVMQDLGEKELEHEKTFRRLREEFCPDEDVSLYDPDGQATAYIRLFADTHVFNLDKDVTELLSSVQSPRSLLKMAIGFEKDTIVFFNALKDTVTGDNKEKVDRLIQEEVEHIRTLNEAIKQLDAS